MSTTGESSRGHRTKTPTTVHPCTGEMDKNIKYKVLDNYYGEQSKLKGFLMQVELYITFNDKQFALETKKVLWVVLLLEGKALYWIEEHLEEYLTKRDKYRRVMSNMSNNALEIFKL
jgi:hypothetical protein